MLIVCRLSHSWGLEFCRVDFTIGLPGIISTTNAATKFLQNFLDGVQPLHSFWNCNFRCDGMVPRTCRGERKRSNEIEEIRDNCGLSLEKPDLVGGVGGDMAYIGV